MDKEKYFAECLKEYKECVLDVVNSKKNRIWKDIESKTVDLMSSAFFLSIYDIIDAFYEETEKENWQEINNFLYQEMIWRLIPGCFGGYDHCKYLPWALESYACGAEHIMERIYPYELGLTNNGYPYYVIGSNLLIAMYYNDKEMMERAIEDATKFVNKKSPKWEKTVIQFLLDILQKDVESANKNLMDVCKGYGRLQNILYEIRAVCIPAYGLYFIAQKYLTEEEFSKIKMPEHKSFEKKYVQWRLENPKPELKPYIIYPKEMDIVNKIYAMPVAKSMLFEHRWTDREKLRMAIDEEKMQQNFIEDLRA